MTASVDLVTEGGSAAEETIALDEIFESTEDEAGARNVVDAVHVATEFVPKEGKEETPVIAVFESAEIVVQGVTLNDEVAKGLLVAIVGMKTLCESGTEAPNGVLDVVLEGCIDFDS